jgi:hypothetical protein
MATPSMLIVPDRYKSGVLYSQLPESGAVDLDVTRATDAYRTNASGVLESVASGVPRLDYPAAGGCPALLVEPAATNLILRSEEFDDAYWSKTNNAGVDADFGESPNGTITADRLFRQVSANANTRVRSSTISISSGVVYTVSLFIKNIDVVGRSAFAFRVDAGSLFRALIDWSNNTIIQPAGTTTKMTELSNNWFHVSMSFTSDGINGGLEVDVDRDNVSDLTGFLLWGAQLETGSVATSYIPTTSATATRNADVISKTAVSGFIGQSVGTLYAEVDVRNFQTDGRILAISNGTSDNRILLQKGANSTLQAIITTASGSVADIATASGQTAGVYKIALAYATNDFVLYVNGSQIGTDTSGAVPACTDVYLGKIETSASTNILNDRIRAAAIYTTRLSNTELASLTSL